MSETTTFNNVLSITSLCIAIFMKEMISTIIQFNKKVVTSFVAFNYSSLKEFKCNSIANVCSVFVNKIYYRSMDFILIQPIILHSFEYNLNNKLTINLYYPKRLDVTKNVNLIKYSIQKIPFLSFDGKAFLFTINKLIKNSFYKEMDSDSKYEKQYQLI